MTESDQAAFASNQTCSKADVMGTTEAATHEDVRKQHTQEHTTTAKRADGVQRTARGVRGASPEPAICDSFVIIPSGLKLLMKTAVSMHVVALPIAWTRRFWEISVGTRRVCGDVHDQRFFKATMFTLDGA